MLHATLFHVKYLLRSRGARGAFLLLFALVLYNFVHNVLEFRGYDVIGMYHPMRLLTMSFDLASLRGDSTSLLIQLLPLVVCLPAGLSLAADQSTGEEVLLISRLGPRRYLISRTAAAFLTTALVVSAPFLLEIVLNCLSFPLRATGPLSNWNMYRPELREEVAQYAFTGLYRLSPYLYALWGTLLFGLFAGLLGAFTASLSAVVRVKYRVLLLLPVFAGLMFLSAFAGRDLHWYNYVLLFCAEPRRPAAAALFIVALALASAACILHAGRKDCLK